MSRPSLDLYHAATVAADAVAEGWGGGGVAFALSWSGTSRIEVLYCRGLQEEVCHELADGSGRRLVEALRRRGEPAILYRDRLPGSASDLKELLEAAGVPGLLLVPAAGPPGVTGILCLELGAHHLDEGEAAADALAVAVVDQVSLVLRALSFTAASASLAVALAERPSSGVSVADGVVVLDRWGRTVFSHGIPGELKGWEGSGFGVPVETLAGGGTLAGLPLSSTGDLAWEEHLIPPMEGDGVPLALAAVPFASRGGDDEAGRIVLLRDLRHGDSGAEARTLLELALRVASDLSTRDELSGEADGGEAHPMIRRLHDFRTAVLRNTADVDRLVGEAVGRVGGPDQPEAVDLHGLVERILQERERELLAEGVRVLRFLRPELSPVLADPVRLQEVVLTMVDHARDSLRPGGGTLTVRTWEEDGQVYIAASDDGRGTRPLDATRAFVPLHGPTDPVRRGEDFVRWARDVVAPWRGRVLTENRPGLWNRVTLMLSAGAAPEDGHEALAPAVRVQSHDQGLEVLVVDDNPSLRSVMRRYLERRGHRVREACDGREALDLLGEQSFDRVVVDIRMPGTDGPTFFRTLDSVAPDMRDRTIFMTGGFMEASVEDFIVGTGRPAIQKPFDLGEMARAVEG